MVLWMRRYFHLLSIVFLSYKLTYMTEHLNKYADYCVSQRD